MGFEIARFVDQKLAEEFKCGICLEVFKEPIMISVCEHIYCRGCITDWIQTDTSCPEDRTPIQECDLIQPIRLIRNLHGMLEINCDFKNVGCKQIIQLLHLANHLEECNFNKVKCSKNCGFEGSKKQIERHDCIKYLKELNVELSRKLVTANNQLKECKCKSSTKLHVPSTSFETKEKKKQMRVAELIIMEESRKRAEEAASEELIRRLCKQCPSCKVYIEKMQGCNQMMCRCGTHFCWSCLQKLEKNREGLTEHFRGPKCLFFSEEDLQRN